MPSDSKGGNRLPSAPTQWHALDGRAAAEALQTHAANGLSPSEAEARLARYGRNALPEEKKETLLAMFLDQFKDFLVLILVGAARRRQAGWYGGKSKLAQVNRKRE
jgi:magnesium-transporting ATPase (P-type)